LFFKTGTLTEEGLDMWGVVPVQDSSIKPAVREVGTLPPSHFLRGLASCHSLTIIEGQLSGDPLDLKVHEQSI